MKALPLFKTHYSLCRSTFTAEQPKKPENNLDYPISLIGLAKHYNLDTLVVVDNSLSGILELSKNCASNKIKLVFGLVITICSNINVKDDDSRRTEAKYIVFLKNTNAYKRLIKISTKCSVDGFYYYPRIDAATLKGLWDDEDLCLVVPFYDSFLHLNSMDNHCHVPDFSFTTPIFLTESNELPFDDLILKRVTDFCSANNYPILQAQSIYYYTQDDFIAYQTIRCLGNRSNLDKPELEHCSSNTFNFERWYKNKN